ncbi:DUF6233 domain-containing protein [Streptomyces sp. TLI_146]|uniref:DUF6233 domain-containing protein n=1 Tax=Streptomyces sp. TLI_146 TaxID=1938858 RepID=UPI000C70BD2C|nr:DUF6233 domain-containing protein [Streptomyces sp. TLI_146]PKV84208.1 hypothetical protein BX283_1719 [Streptomyces sp. TLI_146]
MNRPRPPGLLPPDLPRLEALRAWHALWVGLIDQALADLKRQGAERAEGQRRRPPPPEWTIEHALGGPHLLTAVHTGDCWMLREAGRMRAVDRDTARQALAGGVEPCGFCRPDTALGMID